MGIATGAIAAFISASMAVPAIAYIVGPALQRNKEEEWIRLGSASKVEVGTPTLFKVQLERQSGWIVDTREISVYVLTEDGRNYIAMSNICTHLGCRVRWIGDEEEFFCPCHNAVFDKNGEVVTGPPPRALDRFEVKVEDDQLYVLGG
jgi:Rieske Fe-S protein